MGWMDWAFLAVVLVFAAIEYTLRRRTQKALDAYVNMLADLRIQEGAPHEARWLCDAASVPEFRNFVRDTDPEGRFRVRRPILFWLLLLASTALWFYSKLSNL